MPSPREIEQLKELIGEHNEEISRLWRTLSPVERGWVELPDEEVAELRRRMSQCESELERLKQELSEVLSRGVRAATRKDQASN
jgi:chromosome segregation ATPase